MDEYCVDIAFHLQVLFNQSKLIPTSVSRIRSMYFLPLFGLVTIAVEWIRIKTPTEKILFSFNSKQHEKTFARISLGQNENYRIEI